MPMTAPPRRAAAAVLFAIALGAAGLRIPTPAAPALPQAARPADSPAGLPALASASDLPPAGTRAATPSLAQLPDGRIAVA